MVPILPAQAASYQGKSPGVWDLHLTGVSLEDAEPHSVDRPAFSGKKKRKKGIIWLFEDKCPPNLVFLLSVLPVPSF